MILKKFERRDAETQRIRETFRLCMYLPFFIGLVLFSSCDSSSPTLPTPPEEEVTPISTTPTTPTTQEATIAFYNVENLFDTEDDPSNPRDDEFLPAAAKAWTLERYNKKQENLGKVLQGLNYPVILGLAEVENKKVLEDLIAQESLADYPYQIVHEESPDHRGIDVALIYQANQFTLQDWQTFTVQIDDPSISNFTTRDILLVSGELLNTPVHILVNHWPSRSGGESQTEFRRVTAATRLKEIVDNLQQESSNANIIIMGDFNDEPTSRSIAEVLSVQPLKEMMNKEQLYNCTSSLDTQGEGSYNYQGRWQMLDQIMATGNLLDTQQPLYLDNFQIYQDPSILFTHPTYGLSPDRTYGGNEYYGGYSDHLPVFVEVGL